MGANEFLCCNTDEHGLELAGQNAPREPQELISM
jgi:hypothetical protein